MTPPALLQIDEAEVQISAIRAQGAGGQNVNKVSSATQPTYGSRQRRLEGKSQRAQTKALRGRVRNGSDSH